MVFVYTAMGVLCVEHANVLKLCYIELLSGDSSFRLFSLVHTTSLKTVRLCWQIQGGGHASHSLPPPPMVFLEKK